MFSTMPPTSTTGFTSIANGISNPILKAYKAGGLLLSVFTLGAILMLVAFLWNHTDSMRYVIFGVGVLLTFFTLIYVYLKDFLPLRRAQASVVANKAMIDAFQGSAIMLTDIAAQLQALAFKNANQIAEVLTVARPLIRNVPLIGEFADSDVVVKADGLSRLIVSSHQDAQRLIADLKQALIDGNPEFFQTHLKELTAYKAEIDRLLVGGH